MLPLNLTQKLITLAVTAAIVIAGFFYVDQLRKKARKQELEIEALKSSRLITKREQEASDRVQIELDYYREKNTKAAAHIARESVDWLRRTKDSGTTATGPAACAAGETQPIGPGQAADGLSQPTEQAQSNLVLYAEICAIAAEESNYYRQKVRFWQDWYSQLQKERNEKTTD